MCLEQRLEPVIDQALVPELALKLDVAVLHQSPGLDQAVAHAMNARLVNLDTALEEGRLAKVK